MNATAGHLDSDSPLAPAVEAACAAIAPAWPLDRWIAVNPWWGHVSEPLPRVAARLATLSGSRLLMPRVFYRQAWQRGQFDREHIRRAAGETALAERIVAELSAETEDDGAPPPLPLLAEVLDRHADPRHGLKRDMVITDEISRFCATWFDDSESTWQPGQRSSLYAGWRDNLVHAHGVGLLPDYGRLVQRAAQLPGSATTLIERALTELRVPRSQTTDYLLALLLRVNGWASWCAWRRWQARLAGAEDNTIVELLAVRLAWEWLLDDGLRGPHSNHQLWQREWRSLGALKEWHARAQQHDWVLQRALELAYQESLCAALATPPAPLPESADVQAAFCIDVRSEVFRRALESTDARIQTIGFAGFFGLPASYQPLGTAMHRPQLPGLLNPTRTMEDTGDTPDEQTSISRRRRRRLTFAERWQSFELAPGSIFALVENLGPIYAVKLLKKALALPQSPNNAASAGLGSDVSHVRPRLRRGDPREDSALAAGILKGMGLTKNMARLVVLVGHGSQSSNNPHAAGLDCGACGGQTGEVNARALAQWLNDPAIRDGLARHGITVPETTRFLAALHNTTTDEVTLFDTDRVPDSHVDDVHKLQDRLMEAGQLARRERAASLGLERLAHKPRALKKALRRRANDWGQVRPEWGLADNAAFIAAPRSHTRDLNLEGRAFLHDYDWHHDDGFQVLEQIMTAPMVVAHWINMQYYASTVDNHRYGSGNKVLHNVVGGHIGVLEGNGGDLRVGLPWQSIHDGHQLMHRPLRLSVFIEAPADAIDDVIDRHTVIANLVRNEWLHLFRIDSTNHHLEYRGSHGWNNS